jgi:hypothetical protein
MIKPYLPLNKRNNWSRTSTTLPFKFWKGVEVTRLCFYPLACIYGRIFLVPYEEQAELYTLEGKFKVSLYKALLYFHTVNALKSEMISLKPSYRYLSLENYLHPKDHWLRMKRKERLS